MNFDLTQKERLDLFQFTISSLENYYKRTEAYKVSPELDINEIVDVVRKHDFNSNLSPREAISTVIAALEKYTVHTPHPKYYGLFNPRANFSGIIADLITAVFNPQMAAWSHAPYAAEVENYLIQEFGKKFGYNAQKIDGTFASGGTEANLTAVLCALNETFPDYANNGLMGMKGRPLIYCSTEVHHSIVRAARTVGLGLDSVRIVNVNSDQKVDIDDLNSKIKEDLKKGNQPFMIIGTAGTTGSGVIDDLNNLSKVANKYNLWFHVDAAYGGAAILNKKLKNLLKGIEKSNSITFDIHKWMSVPMGASLFLTSNKEILGKTFRIATEYMPKEGNGLQIVDPFSHSIQWSRRFIGLKLYLSLLIFGWEGYEKTIEHQRKMGAFLKLKLEDSGWLIKNDTSLPIVCFTDEELQFNSSFTSSICQKLIASGKTWISVYPIGGINTLRACITNYSTNENHLEELVMLLNEERKKFQRKEEKVIQD
ncbi:aminotransferase class V-fold PLP-dependent enzyme [Cytophagales bacterium RKSG123]|nr:aminotransferase class V-fold PLP-dependent enzyme [Xanthovirga aplysinae]